MPYTIHYANSDDDFFDEEESEASLDADFETQASAVAKLAGIGITRDRELTWVAMDDDSGKVIGAAWTAMDGNSYEFDVAVHPDYQGQGVGRALLDIVAEPPTDMYDHECEIDMTQRVVSPIMYQALLRRKFEVVEILRPYIRDNGVDYMMRPMKDLQNTMLQLYRHDTDRYTDCLAKTAMKHSDSPDDMISKLLSHPCNDPKFSEKYGKPLADFIMLWKETQTKDSFSYTVCAEHAIMAIAGLRLPKIDLTPPQDHTQSLEALSNNVGLKPHR